MNNGLLFFGAVLIVVLSTLFAAPNFIDWNSYRGVFEEEASKVLGREVRVGGSVNLKFLPSPYVRFEKVRIANVSGQTGEPFVRADSFTMWLSASALLRGVLEASQIELKRPVLTLAVDKTGTGNWSDIKLRSADLPFAPRDVTLRSVKLIDGAISIFNATAERIATIDTINGELSADGLKGPFRFKGTASWAGAGHDLAFATEQPAADGSFGLKISARSEGSPTSYLLDGRISDLDSKPTFKGDWTGQIAMSAEDDAQNDGNDDASRLDLKAKVSADALGAKFDDLTLSLDNVAEPQMITGSAAATWTTPPHLDLALTSKWLDIDRLAGAGQGSASFSKLKQLTLDLVQSVAGDSKASAKINLEQVKVGGETAGGLNIDADRNGNVTHIKEFNVSLPGGTRLDLSGDLKQGSGGKHHFSGNLFVGGTSLARLKAWAGKSGMPIDITSDGPFSFTGKLDIDPARLSISEASGQISGRALAGDLTVSQDGRKRTDLTLQAADLDTREIFPATANALQVSLRKALGIAPSNPSQSEPTPAELPGDMQVRVIAGRLTDGRNVYRDVDVTFETEGKTFRLPAAKLTTENGLKVSLEGRVKTLAGGPSGTLAYDIVAPNADAASDLVRRTGLELFGSETFKGLQRAKLAGLIELGRRTPSASDITFDGTLNDSRFKGAAEFDGGLASWRSRPSRVHATIGSPSSANLLALLGRERTALVSDSDAPAEAALITAGTLGTDAKARFEIAGHGLDVAFDGKVVWPENSPLALHGGVDLKADDFANALTIVGLRAPAGAAGTSAHGTLDIARDKEIWTVATRDFRLGTSSLAAYLQIAPESDGHRRIEGKIGADRVSITPLLAMLTDKPALPPEASDGINSDAAAVAAEGTRSIWPAGVFNFSALDGTNADIRVSFASLDLSGNLATRDGELRLALEPGKVAISDLSAQAAGGRLTGSLSLEKGGSGVVLATDLKLDHVNLSSLSPSSKGLATFEINGGGTAQSPAGLVAVMSGTGSIDLKGASIHGPATSAVAEIAAAVLDGKMPNDLQTISAALLTSLNTSSVVIGDRQLPIKIDGGSVKFDTIGFESPDGKMEATVSADLTSLNVSAACQVASLVKPLPPPPIPLPKWTPRPRAALPPAVVLYEGSLDNLPVIKSSVDVTDLQRELSVRQVERNVQELEQSRRVDEERTRLDREHRKALDAQRAAAKKDKDSEILPPVIPESAGTAGNTSGEALPAETPPDAPVVAPQVKQENAAPVPADAVGVNTVQTPTITVEPIPAPAGDVAVETSTEQPAARSATASRPVQRAPVRRRTSSDEVMRSLGNMQ